jgi:hypothetical protein
LFTDISCRRNTSHTACGRQRAALSERDQP